MGGRVIAGNAIILTRVLHNNAYTCVHINFVTRFCNSTRARNVENDGEGKLISTGSSLCGDDDGRWDITIYIYYINSTYL